MCAEVKIPAFTRGRMQKMWRKSSPQGSCGDEREIGCVVRTKYVEYSKLNGLVQSAWYSHVKVKS